EDFLGFTDVIAADPRRLYISQMEVALKGDALGLRPETQPLADQIGEFTKSYGDPNVPPFRCSGITLSVDFTRHGLASDFRLERRSSVPYEANVYYAQAPLRTADHIAVLSTLEDQMRPKEPRP